MRVRLVHKSDPHTGKGKFAARLARALTLQGVAVVTDTDTPVDIDLQFGKWNYEPQACRRTILRLGPAHIDTNQKYRKLNRPKWRAAKRADGIIYQSQWSRKICHKFLGRPKGLEAVIFNGASEPDRAAFPVDLPGSYWLAVARKWLPQKRLLDIYTGFLEGRGIGEKLVVYGENYQPRYTSDRLVFRGLVDHHELDLAYTHALGLLHLVYLDACPNVVVEALCAGCPVICGDQGGTHELLNEAGDDYGVVLPDREYNYKPINLSKPPTMPSRLVGDAMSVVRELVPRRRPPGLNIDTIAAQYRAFFLEVLNE